MQDTLIKIASVRGIQSCAFENLLENIFVINNSECVGNCCHLCTEQYKKVKGIQFHFRNEGTRQNKQIVINVTKNTLKLYINIQKG